MNTDDILSFMQGFKNKTDTNLKDNMKTTIERAKIQGKEKGIRTLANEYIKLYYLIKEL